MNDTQKRWGLSITYRTENGPVSVDYEIEEVAEAGDIIKRGPDWNSIEIVSLKPNHPDKKVVLQMPLQKEEGNG